MPHAAIASGRTDYDGIYYSLVVWDTPTSKIAQIKKRRKSVSWKPLQERSLHQSTEKIAEILCQVAGIDCCRFSFDILDDKWQKTPLN